MKGVLGEVWLGGLLTGGGGGVTTCETLFLGVELFLEFGLLLCELFERADVFEVFGGIFMGFAGMNGDVKRPNLVWLVNFLRKMFRVWEFDQVLQFIGQV